MIEGRYQALITHEELVNAGLLANHKMRRLVRRLWERSGGRNVRSAVMTGWRDDDACVERFVIRFDSSFWTGRKDG
jgi:hypothetical protein